MYNVKQPKMFYQFSSKRSSTIFGIYEADNTVEAAEQWAKEKFGMDFFSAIVDEKIDENDLVVTVRRRLAKGH